MFRERRKQLGLSLKSLAAQLKISPPSLSRYENGFRRWPKPLLKRLQSIMGLGGGFEASWFLSWRQHCRIARLKPWQVNVEPGPTWADLPLAYEDFYRGLQPKKMPSVEFRRLIRVDSALEACAYALFFEAGARPVVGSPVALDFRAYPLLDSRGRGLGMARKAGILLPNGWILWPQITLQVGRWRRRPDCLAVGPGGIWVLIELDGPSHGEDSYHQLRDQQLTLRCLRYSAADIFGANFAALVMKNLDECVSS